MRTDDIRKMGRAYLQVLENTLNEKKKLDDVDKKALKKDFKDRDDKDIDNDGDVDNSDKYLHKRRKAISRAKQSDDETDVQEAKNLTKAQQRALAKASSTAKPKSAVTLKKAPWDKDDVNEAAPKIKKSLADVTIKGMARRADNMNRTGKNESVDEDHIDEKMSLDQRAMKKGYQVGSGQKSAGDVRMGSSKAYKSGVKGGTKSQSRRNNTAGMAGGDLSKVKDSTFNNKIRMNIKARNAGYNRSAGPVGKLPENFEESYQDVRLKYINMLSDLGSAISTAASTLESKAGSDKYGVDVKFIIRQMEDLHDTLVSADYDEPKEAYEAFEAFEAIDDFISEAINWLDEGKFSKGTKADWDKVGERLKKTNPDAYKVFLAKRKANSNASKTKNESTDRAKHTKGATTAEPINSKASAGENAFVALHGGLKGNDSGIDGVKAAADTARNAVAHIKVAPKRNGDQSTGDKSMPATTAVSR